MSQILKFLVIFGSGNQYLITPRLSISFPRFGHTNSGFDILLESVIGQFYKEEDIAEVVKFFDNKSDLGSLQRGVKKGM